MAVAETTSSNFLKIIVDPSQANVDLVAVHGLNPTSKSFHAEATWTAGDKLWLRDFLPSRLPKARVLLFGYNSNVAFKTSISGIHEHAENLLSRLKSKRTGDPDRPLVFICHSLGGIIVKQMLVLAKLDDTYSQLGNATYGIAFFGTPHRGGNNARLGDVASTIARGILRNPRNNLMEALKGDSIFADSLIQNFRHLLEHYHILSFYETQPFKGLGLVVDKRSATLDLAGTREKQIGLDADHSHICKFDCQDERYRHVRDLLGELVDNAVSQKANLQKEQHYSLQRGDETEWGEQDKEFFLSLYTSNYESHMTTITEAIPGTCRWFLEHAQYKDWLNPAHSRLLWVPGDPGCGKSVLSRFLIEILRTKDAISLSNTSLLYFFCDDKIEAQRTAQPILQALLHQLLYSKPKLIVNCRDQIHRKGMQAGKELHSLWEIFSQCCDDPESQNVITIIDGLDECEEPGRNALLGLVRTYFSVDRKKPNGHVTKMLITSRPGVKISTILENVPKVRLKVEDEPVNIRHDVALVVRSRLRKAAASVGFSHSVAETLQNRLLEGAGPTFLWVSLVLQMLETTAEASESALNDLLDELPEGLDDIYEKILRRVLPSQMAKVKRILQIIVCSLRPLTLRELNVALAVRDGDASEDDIISRLEPKIERTLHMLCGPFLRISGSRVDLVHQTAKEFLIRSSHSTYVNALSWKHSLDASQANLLLARICISILLVGEFCSLSEELSLFFKYCSLSWDTHLRSISHDWPPDVLQSVLRICSPTSRTFQDSYKRIPPFIGPMTPLAFASIFGLEKVTSALIARGHDVNYINHFDCTALTFATMGGHEVIVEQLLIRGANPHLGMNLMDVAFQHGSASVAALLLRVGVKHSSNGEKELRLAAEVGNVELLTLLLGRQVTPNEVVLKEALASAATRGHHEVVKTLLNQDEWDILDDHKLYTLEIAARNGHEKVLKVMTRARHRSLIQTRGGKALYLAGFQSHENAIALLCTSGAPKSWEDGKGRTVLHVAAEYGRESLLTQLLDHGCHIDTTDGFGSTALMQCSRFGHFTCAKLLLLAGADVQHRDVIGCSALCWAALRGEESIVKLLLSAGSSATLTLNNLRKYPFGQFEPTVMDLLNEASRQEVMSSTVAQGHYTYTFPRVTFVLAELNGQLLRANVATGSQVSCVTATAAEDLGLMRIIDTRFAGVARGTGQVKILGRIHHTQLRIGRALLPISITVLETSEVPTELIIGLDFLKRYRISVDFETNTLIVCNERVPITLCYSES